MMALRIEARILRAGIVVGDDDAIRQARRDLAHDRPFARITVATAAKHHDESASHKRPQRLERFIERVRLMRIIDKYGRAIAAADEFETAGRAFELFERREDRAWPGFPWQCKEPAATSAFEA